LSEHSTEEILEYLKQIFAIADENGDGVLQPEAHLSLTLTLTGMILTLTLISGIPDPFEQHRPESEV